MKILLIKPPLNRISIFGDSLIEPLELEILAATVPNHDCRILDMRIDANLKKTLQEFQPALVGITSYTTEVPVVNSLFHEVKRLLPHIFTVVGGSHASVMPEDFHKPCLDAVVVGSGERTFPELVECFSHHEDLSEVRSLWVRKKDEFVFTGNGNSLNNLDVFPKPDRNLTLKYRRHYYFGSSRPAAALMTSRGCPFRCSFCSIWRIMQGKYLTRDPELVASELVGIEETNVFIADDNTLSHARHAEDLCQVIADFGIKKSYKMYGRADAIVKRPDLIEKWRGIGLKTVIMGLESFQDQRLAGFNKKSSVELQNKAIRILKANDVKARAYFIVDPDFTKDDFDALQEYVYKEGITEPMFTILTPLPGTDFYDEARERLILNQYEFFDLGHALLPTRLPRKDFYREFSNLYRKSYPFKSVFREKVTPLRAKRLIGGCISYLKFRSITGKMRYAYKVEEKIHATTCADQSGPGSRKGVASEKNNPFPSTGPGLPRRSNPSALGDQTPG
jgi:radical SAM superfamily enzyme YgiQ (UPF0313 family)